MKNSFFYNTADIKKMKELIRTGEPLARIAKREYSSFNVTEKALLVKLYKVSKNTTKVRTWDGPKRTKTMVEKTIEQPVELKGINVPEGVSLDFTSKRVVMHNDHVRIYF
jgi:hypothetical protein